ncbi:hypothetical protein [Streptomyces sp. NBC_00847]|uniref:hypothetical protein n=1 Tax=Streptomyces sp. NBC_00847 TaxID=2975850 RepID=UPI00224FF711|nr:hypothetical protein [Streptomyces sp. NBC_00847]MCX4881939.1 hypothetical protein [Streptomyces sp. NBC_00847]
MDRLQHSAWRYAAEVLPPEELPMLAAHALVDGRDSPALRELAGLPRRSDETEIRELYVQALHELGIPLPDEETVGRWLLVNLAFGLAKGELGPKDVADRLSMTVAARHRRRHSSSPSQRTTANGWNRTNSQDGRTTSEPRPTR